MSGGRWTKDEKLFLIESWGIYWDEYNNKILSNQRKGEINKMIVDRHSQRYNRTKGAIEDKWRDLYSAYRDTIREANKTGQHTPSIKDLEEDLLDAIRTFVDGDPASEPKYEVDSLGCPGGEVGIVALEEHPGGEVDVEKPMKEERKPKKANHADIMKEMKESTEAYLKDSNEHRREMTNILKKNSDMMEQLVKFLTKE